MLILDTSVWIEFLKNNQTYFPTIRNLLESREILAVEVIFGELLQGTKNRKEKEIILDYWTYLPKEKYENIVVEAGIYSAENKLLASGVGLIDIIILMHALKSDSKIWTLDNKFLRIIPEKNKYGKM
jgi:predicted nucleic acid-binding protein